MTPESLCCRPEFVGNNRFPQRIQGGNELRGTEFSAEIKSFVVVLCSARRTGNERLFAVFGWQVHVSNYWSMVRQVRGEDLIVRKSPALGNQNPVDDVRRRL